MENSRKDSERQAPLESDIPAQRGSRCPSLEDWGLYVAGLQPEARAKQMLEHIGECAACGDLLADSMPAPSHVGAMPSHRNWAIAAAAAIVVVGAALWGYRAYATPPYQTIARVYTQTRPFEFRLGSANYGALRLNRGSEDLVSQSPEFLETAAAVARRLADHPSNPNWLRAKAETDLLRRQYSQAIDELRQAQETSADPEILGDLAIAYLLRAEAEQHAPDTATAIELLTKAIAADPKNNVYWFNRALAKERLPAPHESLDDWKEFLRREPSGGWVDEAHQHVRKLEQLLQQQNGWIEKDALSPAKLLLALRDGDTGAGRALEQEHGDAWFSDFSAHPNAALVDLLIESDLANSLGDVESARAASAKARHSAQATRNTAAAIFADFEHAYSLQRGSSPSECQSVAESALPVAHARNYRWLEAELELTKGACLNMQSRFETAAQAIASAERVSTEAKYSTLLLRAKGFQAAVFTAAGAYRDSMRIDRDGLTAYWAEINAPARAYQFYYDMAAAARSLGFVHTAAVLSREAIEAVSLQANRAVEGMARARFAEDLFQAGQTDAAEREFSRADQILAAAKPAPSTQLYRAYAGLGRARIDAKTGHAVEGMSRIREMENVLPSIHNLIVDLRFLRARAELQLTSGDRTAGAASLHELIDRHARGGPQSATDRFNAVAEVSSAVDQLVELELSSRGPEAALAIRNPPAGASVIFADLPSGPAVWIRRDRSVQLRRLPTTRAELQLLAANLRRTLADPHTPLDRIRALGSDLYRRLFNGVELPSSAEFHIALDPLYEPIPFSVLVMPDGAWLGERFAIAYSPAMFPRSVPRDASIGDHPHLVAVSSGAATTVLQKNLPALPDLETESAEGWGLFPDRVALAGDAATMPAVLKALPAAEIFHFSGHAFTLSSDAALVLSPYLLWASKLKPADLQSCRLAVLAACSTGRTSDDADPASTMSRVFLQLGVPQVIAARWDVDSAATSRLMQFFYQNLRDEKSGNAVAALHRAAQMLRSKSSTAHPFYWAAFDLFCS